MRVCVESAPLPAERDAPGRAISAEGAAAWHFESRPAEALAKAFVTLRPVCVSDRRVYSEILRAALEANPRFLAVWSIWEPDAFAGSDESYRNAPGHNAAGRFVPLWHRQYGYLKLDICGGFEEPGGSDWYLLPMQSRHVCLTNDYLFSIGGKSSLIRTQIAPILIEGRCAGVTGIDLPVGPPAGDLPPGIARRYGAAPVVRVCDDSPGVRALCRLTRRERDVHHWLCQGKSNEEIGIILGISTHTVKNHLERIFEKLGVENRYAAALVARSEPPLDIA